MTNSIYSAGNYAALVKLGIQLSFESPYDAQEHYKRRNTASKVTGAIGNVAGGILGATAGLPGGPAGSIAGSVIGGELAGRALGSAAALATDVAHDIPQKARSQYKSSLSRMNVAGGMPAGVGELPPGYPQQMGQIQQKA